VDFQKDRCNRRLTGERIRKRCAVRTTSPVICQMGSHVAEFRRSIFRRGRTSVFHAAFCLNCAPLRLHSYILPANQFEKCYQSSVPRPDICTVDLIGNLEVFRDTVMIICTGTCRNSNPYFSRASGCTRSAISQLCLSHECAHEMMRKKRKRRSSWRPWRLSLIQKRSKLEVFYFFRSQAFSILRTSAFLHHLCQTLA
jgi:hypothetical protein